MTSPEPSERLASTARGVLYAVALAGVGVLLLALDRFGSDFSSRAILSYGLALSLVALGVLGARTSPSVRVGLAFAAMVSGAGLLVLEATLETLQYLSVARVRAAIAARSGHPFDQRSIPTVVTEEWRSDSTFVPSVVPRFVIEHAARGVDRRIAWTDSLVPLAGVARRRTLQLCNETGQYPTYQSDRFGFNNPDSVWALPGPTLALIGDSFTHGYCVHADSSSAAMLRTRWPRAVSLGTGGSGPLLELATLTEYAIPTGVDVVLWMYFENDLEDLALERAQSHAMRYLEDEYTQRLHARQPAVDSALVEWIHRLYAGDRADDPLVVRPSLRRIVTLQTLRGVISRARQPRAPSPVEQVALFTEALRAAKRRADRSGTRMVFVFQPQWGRFYAADQLVDDAARSEVLASVRAQGIPVIDLTDVFASAPDRETLFAKGTIAAAHYSPSGYTLVARKIEAALDSLGVLAPLPR